jgi:hypothetical protein
MVSAAAAAAAAVAAVGTCRFALVLASARVEHVSPLRWCPIARLLPCCCRCYHRAAVCNLYEQDRRRSGLVAAGWLIWRLAVVAAAVEPSHRSKLRGFRTVQDSGTRHGPTGAEQAQ